MTELEYDLILANAEIKMLKAEKDILLDALEFFGGCRACEHQTEDLKCAVGGCHGGDRKHPENKWIYRRRRNGAG